VVAASVTVILALSAGAAVALTAEPSSSGPVPPLAEATVAQATEPALLSSFALLRRAQIASDVIPASIPVVFSAASGANLALARRVVGGQGEEAWIIPGSGSTCILSQLSREHIGGAACTTSAAAQAGQLNVQSAGAQLPGAELVAGLVPDGVSAVTMHLAGGAEVSAAVHEDVYVALVQGAVTSMSASGPDGTLAIPAMSASAASARSAQGG
jgi:hypothetical protein